MTPHALLAARRAELAASSHATPGASEHSDAFVARVLGPTLCTEVGRPPLALPSDPTATTYRGFPVLAATGFALGAGAVVTNVTNESRELTADWLRSTDPENGVELLNTGLEDLIFIVVTAPPGELPRSDSGGA